MRNSFSTHDVHLEKGRKTIEGLYDELFNEKIKGDRLLVEMKRLREKYDALQQHEKSTAMAHEHQIEDLEEEVGRLKQQLQAAYQQIDKDGALKRMIASRNEKIEGLLSELESSKRDADTLAEEREQEMLQKEAEVETWKQKQESSDENARKLTQLLELAHKKVQRLEAGFGRARRAHMEQIEAMRECVVRAQSARDEEVDRSRKLTHLLKQRSDEVEQKRQLEKLLREKMSSLHLEYESSQQARDASEVKVETLDDHCARLRDELDKAKHIIVGKSHEIDCMAKEIENMLERHTDGLRQVRQAYEERLEEEKGYRLRAMRRVKELELRERAQRAQAGERSKLLESVDERLGSMIESSACSAIQEAKEVPYEVPFEFSDAALDKDGYRIGIRVPPTFSETCALKDELII